MRRGGAGEEDDDATQVWSSWRTAEENRDQLELLKRTVVQSGGATYFIDSIESIENVFLEILSNLREQYVLGYYPTRHRNDGTWHDVRVKLRKPGIQVRAAKGYIDF